MVKWQNFWGQIAELQRQNQYSWKIPSKIYPRRKIVIDIIWVKKNKNKIKNNLLRNITDFAWRCLALGLTDKYRYGSYSYISFEQVF